MNSRSNIDLSTYDNSWYKPGGTVKRMLWYLVNHLVFNHPFFPISSMKVMLLRAFGARIGSNVLIKPCVNIKYPWFLEIGNTTWIGEQVWIDNLGAVKIGSNVCISQAAMLMSGNHNYKKASFDLLVEPIVIEDGAWVGGQSVLCPGVVMKVDSILTAGSVAVGQLNDRGIYKGNPAVLVRTRDVIQK